MSDPSTRTVRVLVDVTGIHRTFDYLVDASPGDHVEVGTEVRVRLGARNVRGWIVETDVEAPVGVQLQPVRAVRGAGPSWAVIDLAHWAAWRWAGHPAQFLRVASAPTVVATIPGTSAVERLGMERQTEMDPERSRMVDDALGGGPSIVRLPPAEDRIPFITEALGRTMTQHAGSSAIISCPGRRAVARLAKRLRATGFRVAELSEDTPGTIRSRVWAQAAAGASVVIGTRNVAWAPAPDPALMIVVDEHDEAYQSTRTPTWHARDVLAERARRAEAPFVALSPCPSLEALATSRLVTPSAAAERAGWPRLEIVDRRAEDPRFASSVLSERLGGILAYSGRTVCVLNRTGRARLLACRSCDALVRCEHCGAAVHAPADAVLVCPRCATERPRVCAECGSAALKNLRIGVSRAREELEALTGEPVAEVTGTGDVGREVAEARVVIGTEAVLHRIGRAETVVFLDIDQELTAPRFRAADQALVLLARGARLLGSRTSGHRLVVQTRLADHPVLEAVAAGNPEVVTESERALRQTLGFPPFSALAAVSGAGAAGFVAGIDRSRAEVLDGGDGTWLVRAGDHGLLSDALAAVSRPQERLRIEVDPLRV